MTWEEIDKELDLIQEWINYIIQMRPVEYTPTEALWVFKSTGSLIVDINFYEEPTFEEFKKMKHYESQS